MDDHDRMYLGRMMRFSAKDPERSDRSKTSQQKKSKAAGDQTADKSKLRRILGVVGHPVLTAWNKKRQPQSGLID